MNLKERGVTVGDLLIISIIILTSIFVFNKVNDDKRESYVYPNPNNISTILFS